VGSHTGDFWYFTCPYRPSYVSENTSLLGELASPERIRRKDYRTRDEARADVLDYIEMFSNPTRKHARNGKLSPVEFERQHKARAEGV